MDRDLEPSFLEAFLDTPPTHVFHLLVRHLLTEASLARRGKKRVDQMHDESEACRHCSSLAAASGPLRYQPEALPATSNASISDELRSSRPAIRATEFHFAARRVYAPQAHLPVPPPIGTSRGAAKGSGVLWWLSWTPAEKPARPQ